MFSSKSTPGLDIILDSYPDVDRRSCQLLGPTALIVQGLLGIFVLLSLVYKRHRETPKRLWAIWLFDVSKQVVGQIFIHSANLLISGLASHRTSGNACVSYFLNILIDTTIGVALIYIILHTLTQLFTGRFNLKGFESGVYGNPPSITYWACQAALYMLSLLIMKLIVVTILGLFPGIYIIGEWLLSWTRTGKGDALQVIFTMGMFPIIMNIVQFWLIDSIVKASAAAAAIAAQDIESTHRDRDPLFSTPAEDDDEQPLPRVETAIHDPSHRSASSLDTGPHVNPSYQTIITIPDEQRSGATSSRHLVDTYAYPPSLSSSISSDRSSILNLHKGANSDIKKY